MAPNTPKSNGEGNLEQGSTAMLSRRAFILGATTAGIIAGLPKSGKAETSDDDIQALADMEEEETDMLKGGEHFWKVHPIRLPLTPEAETGLIRDLVAFLKIQSGQRAYTSKQSTLMLSIKSYRQSGLDRSQIERIESKMKGQYFQ